MLIIVFDDYLAKRNYWHTILRLAISIKSFSPKLPSLVLKHSKTFSKVEESIPVYFW